jgi:adenylosuccinate lyase
MRLVHKGVSRQEAHERIRVHSRETVNVVKMEGGRNDLIERIRKDGFFGSSKLQFIQDN